MRHLPTALAMTLAACAPQYGSPRDAPPNAYATQPPAQVYVPQRQSQPAAPAPQPFVTSPTTGVRSVPAQQWLANCIDVTTGPRAQQTDANLGYPPPVYATERAWCIGEWNKMHPEERIDDVP